MKGKLFKRVTALLSTAAMLLTYADFSAIDFSVHAENGDEPILTDFDVNGNGEIEEGERNWGYELDSADDLYCFADMVNNDNDNYGSANAFLAEDITVNENLLTELITVDEDGTATLKSEENKPTAWTPIGYYSGIFNGNNKTISGLYFNDNGVGNVGLFGYVGTGGKIQDVTIADSYFCGSYYVGGVCGNNYQGEISNCYNTGDVSGSDNVGGVCGANEGGEITNCYNTGDVSGSNYVGGVCGNNYQGEISNCSNTGDVSGNMYVGGVCGGINGGSISNCYNTGDVKGTGNSVGGVCGFSKDCTIENCYNTGDVSGSNNVGGVCGNNDCTITNCYNTGAVEGTSIVGGVCGANLDTISNCYNTGAVTGDEYVGGVCGDNESTISNCYYLDTIAENGIGIGIPASAEAKSAEQFASGEVCWLLNGEKSDNPVFYQNIGKDISPVLDKHHTVIKNGESYKNNAHSYENGFCTICGAFEDGMGARLAGHSLTLDGSIGVNFYMVLDKSVAEDENAYMHFTLPNGKTEDVNVSQAEKKNANGMECYVFKCNVAAKEMTATIKAQMFSGDKQGTVYEYTVKEYADYLFANAYEDDGTTVKNQEYADAYALVESMVNYGAYSQIYFDYNTNALANAGRTDNVSTVTAEKVNKPYNSSVNNLPDGVTLEGANLELESETVLNLLFKNETSKELTFKTSDDVTLTQTMTDDGIKVTITNIAAQHLDEDVIVNVSVADDNGNYSVKYSPMNYCYSVLSNDRTDELKNVMRAFWLYNQQAKAYFQNN